MIVQKSEVELKKLKTRVSNFFEKCKIKDFILLNNLKEAEGKVERCSTYSKVVQNFKDMIVDASKKTTVKQEKTSKK